MNLHIERRERDGVDSAIPKTVRFERARNAVDGFLPSRTARRFSILNFVPHHGGGNANHGAGSAPTW